MKKQALFLLIKSLTRAEKRYFKLYAGAQQRSQNYLLLFDAIDRQAEYDEEALKKKFRHHAFVRQLHVTKNYLTRLILKSLRNFHAQSSAELELKGLLKDVEILFRKELYEHCGEILQKAERLARQYERFPELLEILDWQRRLLLATRSYGEHQAELPALLQGEQVALRQLQQLCDYWALTLGIYDLVDAARKGGEGADPNHPLLQEDAPVDSLRAQVLQYYCLQTYYFFLGDIRKADDAARRLIELLEAHPHRIKNDPSSYLTALNNRVGICLHRKDYPAAAQLLAKVRAVPRAYGLKSDHPATHKLLLQTYNMELEMYRDTRNLEKGIALVQEIEAFLKRMGAGAPEDYQLLFYYQFAYLYFLDGAFEKSLHWLNKILQGNFRTPREDILSYSQLLRLIIHFELGNATVLKYAVESCRRFLKKKRELFPFERALLKFFVKASMAFPAEVPALLQQLETEIFADTDEEIIRSPLDYLDFKSWLEEKKGKLGTGPARV